MNNLSAGDGDVQKDVYVLPASYGQEQLWFFDQLEPNNPVYNLVFGYRVTGSLDSGVLWECLNELIRRHETLRTTFTKQNGKPMQVVWPPFTVSMPIVDLTSVLLRDRFNRGMQEAKEEGARPFNLTEGPLFRVKLIRLEDHDHLLIFNVHHIVFDGWSVGVFMSELAELYQANSRGETSPLPELTLQYADFAHWQKEEMETKEFQHRLSYWEEKLKPNPPRLELPPDYPRSVKQSFSGAIETFTLPKFVADKLKEIGEKEGASLFMVLLAGFKAFLHRYTGQTDLVTGVAVTNRSRSELEKMIGYFVNQLVIRTDVSGVFGFRQLIQEVKKEFLDAAQHDIPFGKLVEHLKPERTVNHTPFFQVMFVYGDESDQQEKLAPGIEMESLEVDNGKSKFDMGMRFNKNGDSIVGEVDYNTGLFRRESILNMIEHFILILKNAANDPDRSISKLPILTEKEQQLLMKEQHKANFQYPDLRLPQQLLQEQAERLPEAVAITGEQGSLTYRELNQRVNQLARYLKKKGIAPGELVGVYLERSWESIISLFAIWKAGGTYLPLDLSYPKERIAMIAAESEMALLVTTRQVSGPLSSRIKVPFLYIDEEWNAVTQEAPENGTLSRDWSLDHLAYVFFTSGSTGRPKGVSMAHRALMYHMEWSLQEHPLGVGDGVLLKNSVSFDPCLKEMCNPLLYGARVVLGPPEVEMRPEKQVEMIKKEGIFRLFTVPAILDRLLDFPGFSECNSLKEVFCGGEALPPKLVQKFFSKMNAKLINVYGPTECCIYMTSWNCNPEKIDGRVPIGYPAPFADVYVLDKNQQPVPTGVPGELYIGGRTLAEGYINRPDLTKKAFIPHLFSQQPGARLYKTGDWVRYREDGSLEFLERIDHQVKIRGVRIELQEIEALLTQHQSVKKAKVLTRKDDSGGSSLVAYMIPSKEPVATTDIRLYLGEHLPAFMLPSYFVWMDAFPVQESSKKINYKAFPSPESARGQELNLVARDRIELEMVKLWEDVLQTKNIGLTNNFFDVGGYSLKAVELLDAINETFGVELPLSTLFQKSTVIEMCDHIRDVTPTSSNLLVCIQQGNGSEVPFVMVHPGGGGVLCYYHLAKALGEHQTVYGIQAMGYESEDSPLTDIHEMADLYVEQLRQKLPKGPYRLLGWSFGATIAYEMTRRFEKMGEKVEFLGLLDAHPIDSREEDSLAVTRNRDSLVAWAERLGMDKNELEGLDQEQQLLKVLRQAQERQVLPLSADVSTVKKYLGIMIANRTATLDYTVKEPIQADLHLFLVNEVSPQDPIPLVDPALWYKRTTGQVRKYFIQGHHHNLVDPPHVQYLGEKIRQVMVKMAVKS
ncbi:non-ribosomal peptide synthetase [Desmospora activa]|uniref:Amino acid adenylation domain-containing protein n=1 Tax=Desmospora activa DSM 45169 TaxID=1121389 RepID=A0A2T4ZAA5_9BACL|nr:non-ribosomal peptide synthetase [Desmospora activa]PTM58822.1 amino acid adenylation domain-containing protein [Desmospora activa DSM 45169]